jgi:hypothetical protein
MAQLGKKKKTKGERKGVRLVELQKEMVHWVLIMSPIFENPKRRSPSTCL